MSEEQSSEKTEEPTDKKLRDARDKGQVSKSQDLTNTWLTATMFGYLFFCRNFILEKCYELILAPTQFYEVPFAQAFPAFMEIMVVNFMWLSFPMLILVASMAVFINFIQIGPVFSFEPIKPDIKKLNPVDAFKKIFSKKNLIEFLKSIIKMVFLGYLVYRLVKDSIEPLALIPFYNIDSFLSLINPIMKKFILFILFGYLVIAIADIFFQRKQYITELKMTKDEVKREFKEMEGDPHIKSERRQLHQEIINQDIVKSSKNSSALVTNPTHIAIAIFANPDVVKLPVVTAKGADHVAKMMIQAAEEAGVPVIQDVQLARELFLTPEYHYVPTDLLEPVAQLLKIAEEMHKGKLRG